MKKIFLLMALLSILACASSSKITNLSPAYLKIEPVVSTYKSQQVDISSYQTFSVFPQSLISEDTQMNEILEKQMLFLLRNFLEAKGYQFVDLNQQPDFLATISVSSKYETLYVPPETATLPILAPAPGQTYGIYAGSSPVPSYRVTETPQIYTRPGYTVANFYPAAVISIFDRKSLELVWLGKGAGTSDNSDVRVSSQFVISNILSELPLASSQPDNYTDPTQGGVGVGLLILTNDGNNYFPTITNVFKRSPAKSAGLQQYDMILAIDGISVVNKSLKEILGLLDGSPGIDVQFDIWRIGEKMSIKVTRTSREYIQEVTDSYSLIRFKNIK